MRASASEEAEAMELYVNYAATTSRAVLAFCEAERVPVTIKNVDIMKGEQQEPTFRELNPNQCVPVLNDDGFVLTEGSAILRYLAHKTESKLYPREPKARARVDELLAWFEANFYKDFGYQFVYPQILPHHMRGSEEGTRRTVEWARDRSRFWLTVLDQHFLAGGKRYLVGDQLSLADYFGASVVSLGELVGCTFEGYPNVRRWYDTIRADASWQKINTAFEGFAASLRGQRFVELS
jgi:glutathione S-transferase